VHIEGGGSIQAIAALQAQDVDMSLIDLNMSGDGGLILAADLRRKRPNMLRLRKVAQ
jgi:CheY-like chemotaxis protein